MIKYQLRDQLPGGTYFAPNNETRSDLQNCPTTNIVSERDFAQYDQKLTHKQTLSDIAVCGVIMFNNNKSGDWLDKKSKSEIENLVKIARYNKQDRIENIRKEKKIFWHTKLISWKRLNLKKRLNCKNSLIKKNI